MQGCSGLAALPNSFGKLSALEELDLSMCRELRKLPDTLNPRSTFDASQLAWQERKLGHPYPVGLVSLRTMDLSQCVTLTCAWQVCTRVNFNGNVLQNFQLPVAHLKTIGVSA